MGRLVGLELENFKSYRGVSRIGFGNAFFTSIIGPNGAGKSNMMDAISFVLGVQSTHLRSHNLKSLIYRGRRDDNVAEEAIEADPTRAHVMAIYERDDGEMVHLKRTITSSGTSEYQINNQTITSLQYSAILKKENILIKARNFLVFQGDVEQIASQSPKDLAKLIETISGSGEYLQDYDRLKEELDKTHEMTSAVFSRRRTLNSESKQYKEQMVEQEIFERKLEEKSDLIKTINLYRIYHNEKKHNELVLALSAKRKELKVAKAAMDQKKKENTSLQGTTAEEQLEIKKLEGSIQELLQNLETEKRNLIPLEANKKLLSNKVNVANNRIKELQKNINSQKELSSSSRKQLKDAERLYRDFQKKLVLSSNSNISADTENEYDQLMEEYLASGGSELKEDLNLLLSEMESLSVSLEHTQNQKDNSSLRIRELEAEIDGLKQKIDEIDYQINDTLSIKSGKADKKLVLVKQKEQCNLKEMELNSKLKEVLLAIEDLSSRQRESKKQKLLRENVSMLKSLFPKGQIKGLVHDLVRPTQRKYDVALSTALGRQNDSIIVETASIAHKCIEVLKERRAGVASFIPLDSLVNDGINLSYLRSIHRGVEPAIDILEYDDSALEQAIHYIVGDSLVIENTDLARELKWNSNKSISSKLITLDGTVIHKSGLMSGGQIGNRYNSLSWDQQELDKLYAVKEDLKSKLGSLENERPKEIEISMITDEINELDDSLPILRSQKANLDRIVDDRRTEINFQKEFIRDIEKNLENIKASLKQYSTKKASVEQRISKMKANIFKEFCKRHGFKKGVEEYENTHGSILRSKAKERTQYLRSIDTLKNKLRFEEERVTETKERKIALEEQLASYEKSFDSIIHEKEALLERIDRLEAEHKVLQDEREEKMSILQGMRKNTMSVDLEFKKLEENYEHTLKEIAILDEELLKEDLERAVLLKNCKIENMNLPLKDGFLDSIAISDNTEEMIKNVYKIDVDYSMLSEKMKEVLSAKIEAELKARLDSVIEEIEQLTPNSKAVERLREVETKLKAFDRDLTKARQLESKTIERFTDIKEKRYDAFMKAFTHISDQIDRIYKELTKANVSPLGGSAYLTLEDEEEPYNAGIKYHAMPPMKRFRDMDQLSGGEKTIAALALLFAIHSFHPSPFFVLDEVDAALDNSNVLRIANYIKKHAGSNYQFIVISLKNALFEKSDALVGIYREQRENSSKTITLDLTEYPDEEVKYDRKST